MELTEHNSILADYVSHMGSDVTVVNAARVSFGKSVKKLREKDIALIRYLAKEKHMSPFEHCVLTVMVQCPIYISKQIQRHRTFSYNEISRRYTSEDIQVYTPDTFRMQAENNRQASLLTPIEEEAMAEHAYWLSTSHALQAYEKLLSLGVCREQARGVLPQATVTKFYMTGNLRNWAHFVSLRKSKEAQGEVQLLAKDIYDILIKYYPYSTEALLGVENVHKQCSEPGTVPYTTTQQEDKGVGR